MKRGLLLSLLLGGLMTGAGAQTRLSVYEAFTGEHCVPCAVANPGLQSLIAGNAAKVLLLNYPTPVPVGGPIFTQYGAVSNARISYYGITTAPQGRLDGTKMGSGTISTTAGHIANLTQADIDTATGKPSPFNISISHAWSVTGDSVTASIMLTAPAAYAPAGASLKLRVALIEHLTYGTAPGVNGEQDFPNVVRDMYPSAAGTAIPATWTMGQNNTYIIINKVARYVDKSNATIVAWIQNDADKTILQAAVSAPVTIARDVATTGVRPAVRLQCVAGSAPVMSSALIRNAGTDTLKSARIYYHNDVGGVVSVLNWTGSLATGAATYVALGAVSVPNGNHFIIDSVALPNGTLDINAGNSTGSGSVSVYNTTQARLALVTGFEGGGAIPNGWILYDADSNGRNFTVAKNVLGTAAIGYGGSTYFLLHNNYYVPSGETNYAILPAADIPADAILNFVYAHAQYGTENDKLEIVYSTDCGRSWTSVWSEAGTSLATAPATTDYYIPTAAQWVAKGIDLPGLPSNAMIAFRATSDYGNSLYIDNVRLESKSSVKALSSISNARLYPNPASNEALLDFKLEHSERLSITLSDITGRTVAELTSGTFSAGTQHLKLPLSNLSAGLYMLRINGEDGQLTKPLSIVK